MLARRLEAKMASLAVVKSMFLLSGGLFDFCG